MVLPPVTGSTHTTDRHLHPLDLYLDTLHLSRIVRVIPWEDFVSACHARMDALVAPGDLQGDHYGTLRFLGMAGLTATRNVSLPDGFTHSSADLRAMFQAAGLAHTRCVMLRGIRGFDDYDKAHFDESTNLFIRVRQAVRLAPYIRHEVEQWVTDHLKDRPFLGVHFRRGDFLKYCQSGEIPVYQYVHQATMLTGPSERRIQAGQERRGCYPPVEEAARAIAQVATQCGVRDLVLSTNAKKEELEELIRLITREFSTPAEGDSRGEGGEDERGKGDPRLLTLHRYEKHEGLAPNVEALVDMGISIRATCFLGNKYSSLTYTVLTQRRSGEDDREKRGWDSAFLF